MTEESDIRIPEMIREDPFKIELNRGMKGQYGWTIKVSGATRESVLNEIREIDKQLRAGYVQNQV